MLNASILAEKALAVLALTPEILRPKVVPSLPVLTSLLEEVFWSSLDKYEDVPLRARLYVAPAAAMDKPGPNIIKLESRVPADRVNIRRLSPAHGRHGALVVLADAAKAEIAAVYSSFRATEPTPSAWLCIECTGTGAFRVTTHVEVLLEFVRGVETVLGGMSFDGDAASLVLSQSLKADDTPPAFLHALNVARLFLSIARAIERDGSGGALWLLPANSSYESRLCAPAYRVEMIPAWADPFREEWERRTSMIRMQNPPLAPNDPRTAEIPGMAQEWDRGKKNAVCAALADLARVDGAIVATAAPDVRAFGVVCNSFESLSGANVPTPDLRLIKPTDPSRPFEGGVAAAPAEFGGSRHQSAINFCRACAPAAAIVASHDGGLTVFASTKPGEVTGMRLAHIASTHRPPPPPSPGPLPGPTSVA